MSSSAFFVAVITGMINLNASSVSTSHIVANFYSHRFWDVLVMELILPGTEVDFVSGNYCSGNYLMASAETTDCHGT